MKNLTGCNFGRLKVIDIDLERTCEANKRRTYWICKCKCGNLMSTRSDGLQSGHTKSCGCLKKEQNKINLSKAHTHKQSNTKLYAVWNSMKMRCHNKQNGSYPRYGGRGIKVCREWFKSYEPFYNWAMSNGYKEGLTIDRKNNSGNYEPSNCRWITNKEQCRNRRTNIKINYDSRIMTLMEFSEITKINYSCLLARCKRWISEYRGKTIDGERLLSTVERTG